MRYKDRPALRNQWFSSLVTVALVVVCVYYAFGIAAAGLAAAKPLDLLAAAAAGGAALILLLVILYRHFSWTFTVSDELVESRRGIIGRDIASTRIRDLRNINVRQSLFQRIFGVGDVEFSSAGGSGIEVRFHGVRRPLRVRALVQDLQGAMGRGTESDTD